jgi:hypothetical protein
MKKITIDGFFDEKTAKYISSVMNGETFMNFKVDYAYRSNGALEYCNIIVSTDEETDDEELQDFFMWATVGKLAELAMKNEHNA